MAEKLSSVSKTSTGSAQKICTRKRSKMIWRGSGSIGTKDREEISLTAAASRASAQSDMK